MKIFDNVEVSIKKIAEVLFVLCALCGACLMLIGAVNFLGEIVDSRYLSFTEALSCTLEDALKWDSLYGAVYNAKLQIRTGFYIGVSAFSMLPLYALGEIVSCCKDIRRNTRKKEADSVVNDALPEL